MKELFDACENNNIEITIQLLNKTKFDKKILSAAFTIAMFNSNIEIMKIIESNLKN